MDRLYLRLVPCVMRRNGLGENRSRAAAFPHLSKWRVPVPFCASATTWCRKTCRACFSMSAHTVLILRLQAQVDGITARDILAEILQQIKPGTER